MLKNKTIISLFSALVFIFPLIYQPLHVVLHHGEHHDHSYGFSSSEEKCLAYEYHFATFDIPEEIHLNLKNQDYFSVLNSFYNNSELNIDFVSSESRAPPTFS